MIDNAIEGLGMVMYWGFTPAINCFASTVDPREDEKPLNVLISDCAGDIRHMLKSISDILPMETERSNPIHIYLHDQKKENLARSLLFLTLICETGISIRERQELFLDLFGNSLIRDRTQSYLEEVTKELIQLITEDDKCASVIKEIIDLTNLKFKERDEIEDVFSSYLSAHKFDMVSLRDHRLRGHFKERYEHRRNLVDWDYQFGVKDFSKSVHQLEYRAWRLSGVGFTTRLANGTIPNRTLGSYIEGKKVSFNIVRKSPELLFGY